jgi:hypothetical protein
MKSRGCRKRITVCNSTLRSAGRLFSSRVVSLTACKKLLRI